MILTNGKFFLKFTSTYEAGINDHHHMIYAMLKSCFQNTKPKLLNYRDFKSFSSHAFEEYLSEALIDRGDSYDKYEKMNKHTPKKKKMS